MSTFLRLTALVLAFSLGCVSCWLLSYFEVRERVPLLLAVVPDGRALPRTAPPIEARKELEKEASPTPVGTRAAQIVPLSSPRRAIQLAAFDHADADASQPGIPAKEPRPITREWPQWGGSPERNNVPQGSNIPSDWDVGDFDLKTGEWRPERARNIKWVARVGSQTYGNPVVAGGRLFVGTNNGAGYLPRYPDSIDLGCLLAFDVETGAFLWQHSSEKLPSGRVHDWPLQGICCAPLVEGDRLWFVTSRGEVICLDTQGYRDNEDDGPKQAGWGNLFRESPQITAGLEQNQFPAALAAVLRACGVPVTNRVRVEPVQEGGWKLTFLGLPGATTTAVRVQVIHDRVRCERVLSDAADGAGELLVEVPLELKQGLSEGTLSRGLLDLLRDRGFPIEECQKVTAEGPKAWIAEVVVAGATRRLKIAQEGPLLAAYKWITTQDQDEADEIWVLDMMGQLGVSQHNMCSCSVTAYGDILFVITSNGVDESHIVIPNIEAPSFLALNKHTGEIYWTDNSPGANIVHGQWASPTVAVVEGVPQVIFPGGDGWLYSFRADEGRNGKPELLWKFDCNPKTAKFELGGRGTRNDIIATPIYYKGRIYVPVGQDPEHGEGEGRLWCIDPTKRGDISSELAVHIRDRTKPLPHRRLQAVDESAGEIAIDNPNSGLIWVYTKFDQNGDGEFAFEECMHRGIGSVTIKDDILVVADLSGIVHCLDAITGKVHWTHDMLSQSWGTPLIVDGKIYIGDEDGEVSVFALDTSNNEPISVVDMRNSVYSTPIVANNVLYIANKTHVFAICSP